MPCQLGREILSYCSILLRKFRLQTTLEENKQQFTLYLFTIYIDSFSLKTDTIKNNILEIKKNGFLQMLTNISIENRIMKYHVTFRFATKLAIYKLEF